MPEAAPAFEMDMNRRIALLAALFLSAQLAPALHAVLPHDEESFHCADGIPLEHFEPHADHPEHVDCQMCTQPIGGGIVLEQSAILSSGSSEPSKPPVPAFHPQGPPLTLACPRAPPTVPA